MATPPSPSPQHTTRRLPSHTSPHAPASAPPGLSPFEEQAAWYAALYAPGGGKGSAAQLLATAAEFSPVIETTRPDLVVLDAGGLELLYGPPPEIAQAMQRHARAAGLRLHVALAANPDAALLAARHCPGVNVLIPGQEGEFLAPLPVSALPLDEETALTLERWGIHTFSELARLPLDALTDRLGAAGAHLWNLARGQSRRALCAWVPERRYQAACDLDDPVDLLEPLLFLLSRLLHQVCDELREQALAAQTLRCHLRLAAVGAAIRTDAQEKMEFGAAPATDTRTLELPSPLCDPKTLLKLLQLELEARPPAAPVQCISLEARPAPPRGVQHHLYLPPVPEPVKLEITLARIAKLAGRDAVGCAELCNTHRPGAFRMAPFRPANQRRSTPPSRGNTGLPATPRLALRLFHPALPAQVEVKEDRPFSVRAPGGQGRVTRAAGPWRSSGEWWCPDAWRREEWDIELASGPMYRLYREASGAWFLEGVYD